MSSGIDANALREMLGAATGIAVRSSQKYLTRSGLEIVPQRPPLGEIHVRVFYRGRECSRLHPADGGWGRRGRQASPLRDARRRRPLRGVPPHRVPAEPMTRAAKETAIRLATETHATPGDVRRALVRVADLLDADLQTAILHVVAEALRADLLHGALPHDPHRRLGVLTEEVLELNQAVNDHAWKRPDAAAVRLEVVQVAAVALRMILAHDLFTITSPRTQ